MSIIYYPQGAKIEERNTASGSMVVETLAVAPTNAVFWFTPTGSLDTSSLYVIGAGGLNGMAAFITPGLSSWTVPNGISNVRAIVIGGGGYGPSTYGGQGGYVEGVVSIAGTSSINIVVGAGSGGPIQGSSSFSNLIALVGGDGVPDGAVGSGGAASGGTLNITGRDGANVPVYLSYGAGGSLFTNWGNGANKGGNGAVILYY
jgi:hypothetical protein